MTPRTLPEGAQGCQLFVMAILQKLVEVGDCGGQFLYRSKSFNRVIVVFVWPARGFDPVPFKLFQDFIR